MHTVTMITCEPRNWGIHSKVPYFHFAQIKCDICLNEVITFHVAAKLNFELDIMVSREFGNENHPIHIRKKKSMRKKKCKSKSNDCVTTTIDSLKSKSMNETFNEENTKNTFIINYYVHNKIAPPSFSLSLSPAHTHTHLLSRCARNKVQCVKGNVMCCCCCCFSSSSPSFNCCVALA